MFMEALRNEGLSSGVVYASGLIKAGSIATKTADFKAQESIRATTERILKENNCYVDSKKATLQSDLEVNALMKYPTPSIPKFMQAGKGATSFDH